MGSGLDQPMRNVIVIVHSATDRPETMLHKTTIPESPSINAAIHPGRGSIVPSAIPDAKERERITTTLTERGSYQDPCHWQQFQLAQGHFKVALVVGPGFIPGRNRRPNSILAGDKPQPYILDRPFRHPLKPTATEDESGIRRPPPAVSRGVPPW